MIRQPIGTSAVIWAACVGLVMATAAAQPAAEREEAQEPDAVDTQTPTATYVGAAVCTPCHKQVAEAWSETAHGRTLTNTDQPQHLQGCEACHGPASEHVGSLGKKSIPFVFDAMEQVQIEQVCGKCHWQEEKPESQVPEAWRRIDPQYWRRTLHARQEISCLSCHKVHGGQGRSLQREVSTLCLGCHQLVLNKSDRYTHKPIAEGKCMLCHVPHGGPLRHLLKKDTSRACEACHAPEGEAFVAAHLNYTVSGGNCLSCHSPHSFDRGDGLMGRFKHKPFDERRCEICHKASTESPEPQLAKAPNQLCLTCHPAKKIRPTTAPGGQPMIQHAPVKQGMCTTCHNPHATNYANHLKDQADYVCFFCHQKVEQETFCAHQHRPAATGKCLLCHRGHVSTVEKLLTKESIGLCQSCHTSQARFTHPVGVRNNKPVRDPGTGKMLVCARCHAVHGSDFAYLLPQKEDDLCRSCHRL